MARSMWVGKAIGVVLGLLLSKFSLLGAIIGLIIGHQFDRGLAGGGASGGAGFGGASRLARQKIFFETIFVAMGRLAKADGRVSEEEIQIARSIMHQWGLGPEDVRLAIEFFNRGKQPDYPIDQQIAKFAQTCGNQPALIRNFMEVLLQIPIIKGSSNPAERELLWRIASNLGIGRVEMAQLEAILRAQHSFRPGGAQAASAANDIDQAYKALGIEPTATDKEVKTAYRRLMNEHHPDKLASKGLPESMQEVAKEKTSEIRAAYELIRDTRGIK